MIYSRTHNFVAIRNPKCGSTTMTTYLLDSKLVNYKTDVVYAERTQNLNADEKGVVSLESLDTKNPSVLAITDIPRNITPTTMPSLAKITAMRRRRSFYLANPKANELDFLHSDLPNPLIKSFDGRKVEMASRLMSVHATYDELVAAGVVPNTTPCYSTIRHPVERWVSQVNAYYTTSVIDIGLNELSLSLLENTQDSVFNTPQSAFFSEAPTLWNIENLHEHISAFIEERGGRVRNKWVARQNLSGVGAENLTAEVGQKIFSRFEKDFVMWEKAFAVYN